MKILHISTNDYGGAGSAAVRIHKAHLSCGLDSTLLVKRKTTDLQGIYSNKEKRDLRKLVFLTKKIVIRVILRTLFKKKYPMYSLFDYHGASLIEDIDSLGIHPDVVVLHWVSGYVGLNDLHKIRKKYNPKILWYMMDMAPITGGCHFSFGCTNYLKNCHMCPADNLKLNVGLPSIYKKSKDSAIKSLGIKIVSPNKFVFNQSKSEFLLYIPIDENIFRVSNKNKGNFNILFGSPVLDDVNHRKGGFYFMEALEYLDSMMRNKSKRQISVTIPGLQRRNFDNLSHVVVKSVPFATNENQLAKLYNSADLFVCSSIEDSGPMMVSEALMSGVPVLGFKTGICPEIIKEGSNGSLSPVGDSKDLADKMSYFINMHDEEIGRLKVQARESAINLLSNTSHCKQFLKIVSEIK